MLAEIRFRPLERATLELLYDTWEKEGGDPVANYSRLISAAMVAAAIIGLTPEQVSDQVETMVVKATEAVRERPDIFGPGGNHD
jgi:hypothetical protein